ncbi:hypothetical protein JAAARDRAFT_689627 [Jaapia argillacea MUCL 33604]|uniref:Uncharacterized protein n=1 Tax=Jaapia argillacea MUCL 33604 TaxID=933084 RepID=A0A067PSB0_9AGAM|nr:hypothetical protein JAAARDRAFT_689627 [Jaapia argillacea MUCL 33604]
MIRRPPAPQNSPVANSASSIVHPKSDRLHEVFRRSQSYLKQPRRNLVTLLNLCAGQLYLPNYETYQQLCQFLGRFSKIDT